MNLLLSGHVPDYAVVDAAEFPIWAGSPRQYRFDGNSGQYVCADSETAVLMIQPFDYRWRQEERWGRAYQAWLDVAFVDGDGCVAQISLKKDSAINLYELFISLKNVDGNEVALCAIECKLTQQCREVEFEQESLGSFFVVEVMNAGFVQKERFESVQSFAKKGCFEWQLIGEVERPARSESFVPQ